MKYLFQIFLFFYFSNLAIGQVYLSVEPKSGDGPINLLDRYKLSSDPKYMEIFLELNRDNLTDEGGLILGREYYLPVLLIKFNGRTIRSSTGFYNYDKAKAVQDYNEEMLKLGLKEKDFRKNKILWLPVLAFPDEAIENLPKTAHLKEQEKMPEDYEIFGKKYSKVKTIDQRLKGRVFYLVAGHGGPDPGAIGKSGGNSLCEDEYAYDVILRLGRNLIKHGAEVYHIVHDPDDGIRDESVLACDKDEIYLGGSSIALNQLERLQKRADIVNDLYQKNKKKAKSQHMIVIHVDSRSQGERLDIFFYHHENSSEGKNLADQLHSTIERKYALAQPGRGYSGFITTRNLFMLRKTSPPTVFLELGNIRNRADQRRFLIVNNRQAMANWLSDGILEFFE